MVNFREGIIDAVGQGLCNTTSLSGSLAQLGSQLWRSLGNDALASGGQDLANAFGGMADVFCDRPTRDLSGEAAQPFTGGQCPGTRYDVQVNFTIVFAGNTIPVTLSEDLWGPISYLGMEPANPSAPPNGQFILRFEGGTIPDGQPGGGTQDVWTPQITTGQNDGSDFSLTGITATPLNGGPDDCGNPPPQPPSYDPGNFSPVLPITFDDSGGNPTTINAPTVYGPGEISVENEFNVPFQIELSPGVNINGNINLTTGDINIGTGGSGGGPQVIPEDEPIPESSVLVGLRLVWDTASINGTRATSRNDTPGGPTIYVPRLAAIRFEYQAPGGTGWGPSISAQSMESVIWAERPALDYDIELNGGSMPTVQKIVMAPSRFFTGATPT